MFTCDGYHGDEAEEKRGPTPDAPSLMCVKSSGPIWGESRRRDTNVIPGRASTPCLRTDQTDICNRSWGIKDQRRPETIKFLLPLVDRFVGISFIPFLLIKS